MKVWIDRDSCASNLSACLSCFGQMMRVGAPDRGCIVNFEDDGSEDFTIFMHADGEDHEPLIIPKDMRERVAFDGWDKFVDFEPRFRKNEGSEGDPKII
jgi:hypothetical protein